jgi:hypothetical protein
MVRVNTIVYKINKKLLVNSKMDNYKEKVVIILTMVIYIMAILKMVICKVLVIIIIIKITIHIINYKLNKYMDILNNQNVHQIYHN